jgi:hypothetical protein
MTVWTLPLLLAVAAPPEKSAAPVQLTLTVSVKEVDPAQPGAGVVTCSAKNVSDKPVAVPVGYSPDTRVLLHGGPLMLMPRERTDKEPKKITLAPGQEMVLFQLPLDDILLINKGAEKTWQWEWFRRLPPPKSPLYVQRGETLVEEIPFKATAYFEPGLQAESPVVTVKVKGAKKPEKDK